MVAQASNFSTFVVANPCAGAGEVEREWPRIERLLRAKLPELDYAFTEGPGHATLLAREALRAGWEMVLSVGGDGTLNEVVNGFWEPMDGEDQFRLDEQSWIVRRQELPAPIAPEAALGMIPMGTGGDFRRTVGLMGDVAETIEHLGGRRVRQVDVGQMGYLDGDGLVASRLFLNIASAGMSGLIDSYVNRTWKGLGGRTSFLVGTVRGYFAWRPQAVEVRLDDTREIEETIHNLVVANGEYFGGGMWVAPGAEIDDAHFQVVVMREASFMRSLRMLAAMYRGEHLAMPEIYRLDARQVSARPPRTRRSAADRPRRRTARQAAGAVDQPRRTAAAEVLTRTHPVEEAQRLAGHEIFRR